MDTRAKDIARDYIQSTGAGVIVNDIDDIEKLDLSLDSFKRTEWVNSGAKKFGMESIGANYTAIYNRLINL